MFCGSCGRELPESSTTCPACGYKGGFARNQPVQPTPVTAEPTLDQAGFSQVPEEIRGWNWGAAGLTWIWGLYFRVWISLLTFIPIINWFWWIVLGIKGNEWAWRKGNWSSVEEFRAKQAKWRPWGIAIFILGIIISIWQWYYLSKYGG